jgi:hypothetical protein
METFLTRAITIVALTCVLVVGAAATSILGGDSVPAVPASYAAAMATVAKSPDSNRQAKSDKLAVASYAFAASASPEAAKPGLPEPLRQAYAAAGPADLVPNVTAPLPAPVAAAPIAAAPIAPPKPKAAAKPPVQKNYALLSDHQIAVIKERLKLSPDQEAYWPGVEKALRAIARKIHSTKQANPADGTPPIDMDSDEVAQLKSAAMPLLFQLREDQKSEVRSLARIIGLERVASMI